MANRTQPPIAGTEVDMSRIRDRFGGTDLVAAILGMFTALGVLVFLGALIAAGAGEIPYQVSAFDADGNLTEPELVTTLVVLSVLFVAFLVGGWTTGRVARYDGAVNGLGAGLLFVLLTAVFAALGAFIADEYNAFALAGLPDWFSGFDAEDATLGVWLAGAAGIAVTLLGGWIGGAFGEQFHREADAALVQEAVTD